MPAVLTSALKMVGGTLVGILTSVWTSSMVEWLFWKSGEILVKKSDATWDDELLEKMRSEREKRK